METLVTAEYFWSIYGVSEPRQKIIDPFMV